MDFDLLRQLSESAAISGREQELQRLIKKALQPLADEVKTDVMGNVIAIKRGQGKGKVMLAAHVDEIGFMVKFIDKNGFLRLHPLGGFDLRQLFAQKVTVYTQSGENLCGILAYATKPIHMLEPEEKKRSLQISNFFVDLGMSAEQVKNKVAIGDAVVMKRTMETCGDCFSGKAMDDRAGVFVMIEALRMLKQHQADIYGVATVQEEVGLRGAKTAAYAIEPDISIAVDTTLANDYPGPSEIDAITRLGHGVALKLLDSTSISHPKLLEHFKQIAQDKEIPYQLEILPRGGTDAAMLQRTRAGSACITLSIPTRYIHTVNEMVHRKDLEAGIRLLACYLEEAHTGNYSWE